MNDEMADQEVIDLAVRLIAKAREKGQEENASIRLLSDLARRLDLALLALARSDMLIRKFYKVDDGVIPLNYRSWVKVRDAGVVEA